VHVKHISLGHMLRSSFNICRVGSREKIHIKSPIENEDLLRLSMEFMTAVRGISRYEASEQ
jgi:hypothetical protein